MRAPSPATSLQRERCLLGYRHHHLQTAIRKLAGLRHFVRGMLRTDRVESVRIRRLWSCPYQTGQVAVDADCAAMNSRGERMRKPL